jgi:hypothetical protein
MAMTLKLKFLLIVLFALLVIGVAAHVFFDDAFGMVQNQAAAQIFCVHLVSKLAVVFIGALFLD